LLRPSQTPGTHPLFINATTNGPHYRFGAWYRFDLTLEKAPWCQSTPGPAARMRMAKPKAAVVLLLPLRGWMHYGRSVLETYPIRA